MHFTLSTRIAILQERRSAQPGVEIWRVSIEGQAAEAVAYTDIVGPLAPGARVLVNTTAVELELGTGGQHFIIARLDGAAEAAPAGREDGHILKLRYTPLQGRVLAAEEEASPYHDLLREADRLPGTPVVCLGLHSQLAPAAAGVKAANPALRVAYVMTDSAALPLAYSRQVAQLRAAGLLDVTVTAGQAFGGELEAVNPYSALVVAALAGQADVIIAGQGPGNVGTHTALGFGGVEQAMLLNTVAALEGTPIAVPRISFADPRPRHQGISHHTLTVLGRLALAPAQVPLPVLPPAQADIIRAQLADTRHDVRLLDGAPGIAYCQQAGISLRSMGRGYEDDPAFFLAAAAAGRLAGSCFSVA
jgi:hypothetical protein